ncbi:hypothetical protein [Microbacterium sp.]|uniref:hypothetical protein n=1 Tax=Microbacterium sp. TaxID=51671 RepID=UPI00262AFCA9|nr:hypothetical protein [Microbacterium sp.]
MSITPDTFLELIQSAAAVRAETQQEVDRLRKELQQLEATIASLEQEEQGYRLALARRFPDTAGAHLPQPQPGDEPELFPLEDDLRKQSRSDAVETAVRVISKTEVSATPAHIEAFLHERGRDDTRDAIGAALAYLNRTGRVTNIARGQWRLSEGE